MFKWWESLKKRWTCYREGHDMKFIRNIYGDDIIYFDARSIYKCKKCGKFEYRKELKK